MKLISFHHPSGPRPGVALSEKVYLDLVAADPDLPRVERDYIERLLRRF